MNPDFAEILSELTAAGAELRLFYGSVQAAEGTRRFGWMAEDALAVSAGGP
jgi:hypothetical protein